MGRESGLEIEPNRTPKVKPHDWQNLGSKSKRKFETPLRIANSRLKMVNETKNLVNMVAV